MPSAGSPATHSKLAKWDPDSVLTRQFADQLIVDNNPFDVTAVFGRVEQADPEQPVFVEAPLPKLFLQKVRLASR